jgi:3-oxoacyl-[acyl-carrier protein] reductase
MTDALSEEIRGRMLEAVSLGRFGTAEDVAHVALFLAGADYVTGQTIIVDGGLIM